MLTIAHFFATVCDVLRLKTLFGVLSDWIYKRRLRDLQKIHYTDMFSLDVTFSTFILPRLIELKEYRGRPGNLTDAEWAHELDKMIRAFSVMAEDDISVYDGSADHDISKGLLSFAKYFRNLWT